MDKYESEKALYSTDMKDALEKFILSQVKENPQYIVNLIIAAKKLGLGAHEGNTLPSPRYLRELADEMVERGLLEKIGTQGIYAQIGSTEQLSKDKKALALQVYRVEYEVPAAYLGAEPTIRTVLAVSDSERHVWDKYESRGAAFGCLTKVVKIESLGPVDSIVGE